MTKTTPELKAKIIAERSSMTTTGLASKYGISPSSVRRILRDDGIHADKKKEPMNLPSPEVVKQVSFNEFKKSVEPINLIGFSLTDKSTNQIVNSSNVEEMEIEKITADDDEETNTFAQHFVEDDDDDRPGDADGEADDDDGTDGQPNLFGSPEASNSRLNKMAEAEMEREALEASEAIDRLLGDEATQSVKQSRNKPTPEEQSKRIEDEAEQRAKYLSRIYLNVINFSEHLPFIKNQEKFLTSLHRKNTKELIALCQMIETQRSLGNVANQMKHSYFMMCRGAELLSQKYARMKTQGFTDEMLKKERELSMIFQEIAIESADTLRAYTTPTMRLAMLTASTLILMDNKNRMEEVKEHLDAKPVAPEISKQYEDI